MKYIQIVIAVMAVGIMTSIMFPVAGQDIPAKDVPKDSDYIELELPTLVLPTVVIPQLFTVIELSKEMIKQIFETNDIGALERTADLDISKFTKGLNADILKDSKKLDADIVSTSAKTNQEVFADYIKANNEIKTSISTPDAEIAMASVAIKSEDGKILKALGKNIGEVRTKIDTGIKDSRDFMQNYHPKNFITDKYSKEYMLPKDIYGDNMAKWKKWKKVFEASYKPMRYVPMNVTNVKMVCEMGLAKDEATKTNLINELKYFKALGFNTVLASWSGEPIEQFVTQIQEVKELGFKVFFCYGDKETVAPTVWIDPDIYRDGLISLAEVCDGYLIGWRRTSLHLFKQEQKWVDYSISCVREGNPSIPIIGEAYRGYMGSKDDKGDAIENEFKVSIPTNASAIIVINLGYSSVRPDGVLKLMRAVTQLPLIILVVGEKPYYMTRVNFPTMGGNGKSKAENREIITRIENKFKKQGFGIATLTGDGSGGNYDKNVSDDLCMSQWSK